MDALSEVLRSIRLTGGVFLDAQLQDGWSLLTPPPALVGALHMPGSEHVIPYHLVTEGRIVVRLVDGEPVELRRGELVVFPHGDRHVLSSVAAGDLEPLEITAERLHEMLRPGEVAPFCAGNGGVTARMACGYLACDRRLSEPVLAALPRLLKVDVQESGITAWLQSAIQLSDTGNASPRPGGEAVLARLSELLFVEAVRQYIDSLPPEQIGWMAGLRDRFVGRALALLHRNATYPWTVEELARQTGLSRSALAERFVSLLGMPPMQYLTRWRVLLAARRLLAEATPVARIAADVGYDSEAAFSRAFKREMGMPPGAWRQRDGTVHGVAAAS